MKSILKTISQTLSPNQEVSSNETNDDGESNVVSLILKIIGGVIAFIAIISIFAA